MTRRSQRRRKPEHTQHMRHGIPPPFGIGLFLHGNYLAPLLREVVVVARRPRRPRRREAAVVVPCHQGVTAISRPRRREAAAAAVAGRLSSTSAWATSIDI